MWSKIVINLVLLAVSGILFIVVDNFTGNSYISQGLTPLAVGLFGLAFYDLIKLSITGDVKAKRIKSLMDWIEFPREFTAFEATIYEIKPAVLEKHNIEILRAEIRKYCNEDHQTYKDLLIYYKSIREVANNPFQKTTFSIAAVVIAFLINGLITEEIARPSFLDNLSWVSISFIIAFLASYIYNDLYKKPRLRKVIIMILEDEIEIQKNN